MNDLLAFLTEYGYLVLFGWVLLERVGLPLPAIPVLMAAGALARSGRLHPVWTVVVAVSACLLSDGVWYEAGRRRGIRLLRWLCRISLEPDSCVRKTEEAVGRHGARALLFAKFLPGLNVVAVPIIGMLGMKPSRFLMYDAAGALVWVIVFMAPGYLFSTQLERVAELSAEMGVWLLVVLLAALGGYLAYKYIQRVRFRRALRIARIEPRDVSERMQRGDPLVVLDLRHSTEFAADPRTIPGAIHIPVEDLAERHQEIQRDREIVLYCT